MLFIILNGLSLKLPFFILSNKFPYIFGNTSPSIGNNTIIWSGNHIGHHSKIGNNCFISSHVVVSGFCIGT